MKMNFGRRCRNFQDNNGTIWAESPARHRLRHQALAESEGKDKGSTFFIELPVK